MVAVKHRRGLFDPDVEQLSITGLSKGAALNMYKAMLRVRRVEESLIQEYHPADEMRCPIHFCLGQEGPSVGVSTALRADDYLFSHHRSHGYYLAKGGSLKEMFAELYGKATGSNGGKAGHQEISDISANFYSGTILVGHLPIAAGVALTFQTRRQDRVATVVFGDGGADEGTVYETLNFTALKALPLIFICENNSYSVYTQQSNRQPSCNLAERARAFGVPSRRLYGNDVAAVHRATRRAVAKARRGDGPTFLELITYRWCGHVGPEDDDHFAYRSLDELADWRQRCPIAALEKVLLERGILSRTDIESLETEIVAEIQDAFTFAKTSPYPGPEQLLTDNFAEPSASANGLEHQLNRQMFDFNQPDAQLRPY